MAFSIAACCWPAAAQDAQTVSPPAPKSPSQPAAKTTAQPAAKATKAAAATPAKPAPVKTHKLAIQVNDSDPKTMNLALNNAENVLEYYKSKGEKAEIEIVTYGPGLDMLRSDKSPVKQRIAAMSLATSEITFAACGNTQQKAAKAEGKDIPLVSEAKVVQSGVVRLMELQKKGYAYIRP